MNEISMAILTPQGLALVVGCSNPCIEKILDMTAKIEPLVYNLPILDVRAVLTESTLSEAGGQY